MIVYSAKDYPQGSPEWWSLRRGIITASSADRILTPKRMQFSAQATDLVDELIGDILNQSPNWFSEKSNKPPNKAIQNGIEMEHEARQWYAMTHNVEVEQVGFIMHDDRTHGCSPDGCLKNAGVEIKCPGLKSQSRYGRDPQTLLDEYICQTNFQLLVTGWDYVDLVSYSPPLDVVQVRVHPGPFTVALKAALKQFLEMLEDGKRRLGIGPTPGEVIEPQNYPF